MCIFLYLFCTQCIASKLSDDGDEDEDQDEDEHEGDSEM